MPATTQSTPLVAAVDHLMIHAADADTLLDLFATTFALPLNRPMTVERDAASGGVTAGDANAGVEVLRYSARLRWDPPPGTARIGGLALTPTGSAEETLALLEARGIGHSEPYSPVAGFTNVLLPELIPGHLVFLCHTTPAVYERRRSRAQELHARDGGPLGILGVQELVIAVSDVPVATERWQRLLAPTPVTIPGPVPLREGPGLRFETGSDDAMMRIVFRVKDVNRTADYLDKHGLRGDRREQRVSINPERVQMLGLDFAKTA